MAAENSKHAKKRKRGPYLSYLTNPLKEEVPRNTLKCWSRESHEKNVGENKEDGYNRECTSSITHVLSSESGAENVEEANEGEMLVIDEETPIEDERVGFTNSAEGPDSGAENVEEASECPNIETTSDHDPDDVLHLYDDEQAFADDYDEEGWEELWEADENLEKTSHEEDQQTSYGDQQEEKFLLYPGAGITLGMSMLLIITFAMRHQLPGTALADLLTLIDLHLIAPNCFTRSMATLHKFFKQLKNPVQFHHYCSFCYEYIGIHKRTCCTNKHCLQDLTKKNSLSYFIVIPLEAQLEALLASKYRIVTTCT